MFTKGQKVTYISNWDNKGTVKITNLVVASCGKKQMILVDEAGVKFQGANFRPQSEQYSHGVVFPRLTTEEAEASALEIAAKIIAYEEAHFARCLAGNHGEGYNNAIRKSIAKLHQPDFKWA